MKCKSIVSFYATKSLEAFNPNCDEVADEIIPSIVEKTRKSTITAGIPIHFQNDYL